MNQAIAPAGVVLLGATGRTGRRVLTTLLQRGVPVCAIVRSAARLPEGVGADPLLTVVEADLATMPSEEMVRRLAGRGVVISCLGHTISLRGMFGPPRDLVEGAVRKVRRAIDGLGPASPVRLILMGSVSVNLPARGDTRRGSVERAFLWFVRAMLPPARDNQRAADVLALEVGTADPFLEWVVVRPDTLVEGEASAYTMHDGIVASLFRPRTTRMANVAHVMAELAMDPTTWRTWKGKMPVVVDGDGPAPR